MLQTRLETAVRRLAQVGACLLGLLVVASAHAAAPATYITSFRLDGAEPALMAELVARFPSVTVIDIDALMRQVRQVMDRVAQALTWVFVCALAAGGLVLAAPGGGIMPLSNAQMELLAAALLVPTVLVALLMVRRNRPTGDAAAG